MSAAAELHAAQIRRWFAAALASVDPEQATRRRIERLGGDVLVAGRNFGRPKRVIVVGVGKAAMTMALGVEDALGDRVDGGLVITKDGHAEGRRPSRIEVREASHPIPDERGVAASQELLTVVDGLDADDLVIALISGGGSALLELPVDGVSLDDIARTTDLLLRAGAPIEDLNAVRVPLSMVKGGGLRRAAWPARMATLILSDVLGNDTRVIASGPTTPSTATGEAALAVLARYGLIDRAPDSIVGGLSRVSRQEHPARFDDDLIDIIADNAVAVEAMASAARADGYAVRVEWTGATGEARELARRWVDLCAGGPTLGTVLIGGGEATVTVRGGGAGGRNTEFALAAAIDLDARGLDRCTVASLATDGQDAETGVAGAIASAETARRARSAGVDPRRALDENDSLKVFRIAGGAVETGPTGTNVNDLYVAVR